MSCILPVERHMDDCSGMVTRFVFHANFGHHFLVSDRHIMTIHLSRDTMSADLFYLCYARLIQFAGIGLLQTETDRMRGMTLCKCRILQHDPLFQRTVMDRCYLKVSLCNGAGLIKGHNADL